MDTINLRHHAHNILRTLAVLKNNFELLVGHHRESSRTMDAWMNIAGRIEENGKDPGHKDRGKKTEILIHVTD